MIGIFKYFKTIGEKNNNLNRNKKQLIFLLPYTSLILTPLPEPNP